MGCSPSRSHTQVMPWAGPKEGTAGFVNGGIITQNLQGNVRELSQLALTLGRAWPLLIASYGSYSG